MSAPTRARRPNPPLMTALAIAWNVFAVLVFLVALVDIVQTSRR